MDKDPAQELVEQMKVLNESFHKTQELFMKELEHIDPHYRGIVSAAFDSSHKSDMLAALSLASVIQTTLYNIIAELDDIKRSLHDSAESVNAQIKNLEDKLPKEH